MEGPPTPGPIDAKEWGRVREILHRALELAPELRPAYLDQACGGDAQLRAQVQSLIAASEKAAFIDRPILASALPTVTLEPPPAPPSLLKASQIIAHYQVVEKIGEGGMGEVYKALDRNLGRPVALKVIAPSYASGHEKRRFAREAKAASALNHPNIVTIYEFNTENGLDFIAMEYIDGPTLHQLISGRGSPLATLLEYARQAAGALDKAHAAGIVHRDLKPNNIMVTGDGCVKVLDFGLAKHEEPTGFDPEGTQALTRAGAILGTAAYMSPEQAMGEPADWRADIFSLGVILYEITCGRRPFQGDNSQATLHQIAHNDPPAAAEVNPAASPGLASLIEKCLKKDREQRPQSMAEVAAALAGLVHGPASIPASVAPKGGTSRRRVMAAGAAGAVAIAAGLLVSRKNRVLNYSIEAQKMRDGKPAGEPYMASEGDTFEGGWRFRLHLQPPHSGFLYVVNRGPGQNGTEQFWILYSAAAQPGREAVTGWYVFDQNPGTERLWIVSAPEPVVELDQPGRVESPATAARIRDVLAAQPATLLELRHR